MASHLIAEASAWFHETLPTLNWARGWTAAVSTFGLVAAAEFGDKSQLVCMTLAAKHRHWPVLWGAMLAFGLLNGVAVAFGAAVGHWLPENVVAWAVAVLFAVFGVRSLMFEDEADDGKTAEKTGHGIFLTTFLMIFLAEFGDKTQIAVAGLGAAEAPLPVWVGATLALTTTSAVGIWAGRTVLQKVPQHIMHRIGGALFLGFAGIAGAKAVAPDAWGEVETFLSKPLISLLIGSAIGICATWFFSWLYYKSAGDQLRMEADRLHQATDCILYFLEHSNATIEVRRDASGRSVGLIVTAAGKEGGTSTGTAVGSAVETPPSHLDRSPKPVANPDGGSGV